MEKTLSYEQNAYEEKLKSLLSEKKELEFSVSDMVRAKCVFLKIPHIIRTVN